MGEAKSIIAQKLLLDSEIYTVFNNLYLHDSKGSTQVDHVILSKFGIFVVETKERTGLIYGSERGRIWTQVINRQKFKFQNPIHQNYRHIKVLAKYLNLDEKKFLPVIKFWGDCRIETEVPEYVLEWDYTKYIKSKSEVILSQHEIYQAERKLRAAKDDATLLSGFMHVHELKKKYTSTEVCPKCGGQLVERVAKQGKNAGNKFLGCSNFPKCRYILQS